MEDPASQGAGWRKVDFKSEFVVVPVQKIWYIDDRKAMLNLSMPGELCSRLSLRLVSQEPYRSSTAPYLLHRPGISPLLGKDYTSLLPPRCKNPQYTAHNPNLQTWTPLDNSELGNKFLIFLLFKFIVSLVSEYQYETTKNKNNNCLSSEFTCNLG